MRVTDYDVVSDNTEIRVEIENSQWVEISVKDFLLWLVDKKVWFLDSEELLISIPDSKLIWNEKLNAYICTTANVSTYTWERFNKQYRHKLENWFQEYVNEKYDEAEILDNDNYDEWAEIDSAIQYRRKFA